mmetsp:Transcript_25758/g.96990  ORF Transcript_25758/g.96990 Transcript_25758/m.96990 type:complete len:231 (-) Transcript_25758:143-835(-)
MSSRRGGTLRAMWLRCTGGSTRPTAQPRPSRPCPVLRKPAESPATATGPAASTPLPGLWPRFAALDPPSRWWICWFEQADTRSPGRRLLAPLARGTMSESWRPHPAAPSGPLPPAPAAGRVAEAPEATRLQSRLPAPPRYSRRRTSTISWRTAKSSLRQCTTCGRRHQSITCAHRFRKPPASTLGTTRRASPPTLLIPSGTLWDTGGQMRPCFTTRPSGTRPWALRRTTT